MMYYIKNLQKKLGRILFWNICQHGGSLALLWSKEEFVYFLTIIMISDIIAETEFAQQNQAFFLRESNPRSFSIKSIVISTHHYILGEHYFRIGISQSGSRYFFQKNQQSGFESVNSGATQCSGHYHWCHILSLDLTVGGWDSTPIFLLTLYAIRKLHS